MHMVCLYLYMYLQNVPLKLQGLTGEKKTLLSPSSKQERKNLFPTILSYLCSKSDLTSALGMSH